MALAWEDAKRIGESIKRLCNQVGGKFVERVNESEKEAAYACYLDGNFDVEVRLERHHLPESRRAFYEVHVSLAKGGDWDNPKNVFKDFTVLEIGGIEVDVEKPERMSAYFEVKEPEVAGIKNRAREIRFYHNEDIALSKLDVK